VEEERSAQGLNTGWNMCGTFIHTTGKLNAHTHTMYVWKLSVRGHGRQPLYITYQYANLYITYWSLLVTDKAVNDCSGISILRTGRR
jgi:hypothetical protein